MDELSLTKAIAAHLRLRAADGVLWFHVPNGEYRSPRTGARLKAMGVRRGVADFMIFVPTADGPPRTIALEVKTARGRQSPEQREFQADCEHIGITYHIVRSINDFIDFALGNGVMK